MLFGLRKDLTLRVVAVAVLALAGCGGATLERRVNFVSGRILDADRDSPDLEHLRREMLSTPARYPAQAAEVGALARYTDATVKRLFEALSVVSSVSAGDGLVPMQRRVFEEKVRRNLHNEFDVTKICKSYLGAREFSQAREIKERFPGFKLPEVPKEIPGRERSPQPARWRAYDVLSGGREISPVALPLDSGPSIVMVMHTGCSVAQTALESILADPEMSHSFKDHGYVISDAFDSVGVSLWRDHFKFSRVYLTTSKREFPGMAFDEFPRFYFMAGGRIVAQATGWTEESKESYLANVSRLR